MDEIIQKISNLIEHKAGLSIDSIGESYFNQILLDRIERLGIQNFESYLERLSHSTTDFQDLIEHIIVPETWFFRNPSSYSFLGHYVLNVLIPTLSNPRPIRILSLPCSTGEEPYSIAIKLLELNLTSKDFTIDAIDISKEALNKAKKGVYTSYSFRSKDCHDIELRNYFDIHLNQFKIKQMVTECVNFHHGNALHLPVLHVDYYDIIFCKNLFIYMLTSAQQQLLNNLDKMLKIKGLLIVSPVEMECVRKFGYTPYQYPQSYAFQKNIIQGNVKDVSPEVKVSPNKEDQQKSPICKDPLKRAKELADGGLFEEAAEICHLYLNQNDPNSTIYFILGLIEHAKRNESAAEEYFLKTIYMDSQHYEALIYLALLAKQKGEDTKSKNFLNRAKRVESHKG